MSASPTSLEESLRQRVARHGPLRFDAFMEACLYAPDAGYYTRPVASIGRSGDFVTSPTLSPAFGRTLRHLLPLLAADLGPRLRVVDAGAGDGSLLAALLGERSDSVGPELEPVIVERGAGLRARAAQRLASLGWSARALESTAELPALPPAAGLVLANELFDAQPVRRQRRQGDRLLECFVVAEGDGLRESWRDVGAAPQDFPEARELTLAQGVEERLAELAAAVGRGLVLIIDYGYPRAHLMDPLGKGNPVRGFREGRLVDDPLAEPGRVDLTAHVDFSRLHEAADALGLESLFFTDQVYLLLALGFLSDPQAAAARRLIHPEDMGGAFRVLALARRARLDGVRTLDVRDRLAWLRR